MVLSRLLLPLALVAASSAPTAQKLQSKPFEDSLHGFRVRAPKWPARALPAGAEHWGVLLHLGEEDRDRMYENLLVVRLPDDLPAERVPAFLAAGMELVVLERNYENYGRWLDPVADAEVPWRERTARHLRLLYDVEESSWQAEAWCLPRNERAELALVYFRREGPRFPKEPHRQLLRSLESFEYFPPVEQAAALDYDGIVARYEAELAPIEGWRVVRTPSEKFVVLTSHDDDRFVGQVIERLERSRELFEADFPPTTDGVTVSPVRLCSSELEFHRYGGTSEGVVGWFSPGTTELVLYDAQEIDRNMTFAVMSHEAFHQYCHFLFGRLEAPRWFDEGLGDYYGGIRWTVRGKPEVTARMPSGLERLSIARELARENAFEPLAEHLVAGSESWGELEDYAQSWSIIFMLREGMRGKVHRSVWREEYGRILPAYLQALRSGYAEALAENREAVVAERAKEGEPPLTEEELEEAASHLPLAARQAVWQAAVEAAFAETDLATFEEDWMQYVRKHLR